MAMGNQKLAGLVGVILLATSQVCAAQQTEAKSKSEGPPASRAAVAFVDPRYASPRATVRTFLIAMNLTEDDPHKIDEAIACLDLSGIPAQHRGRFAFELEFILRSINMPTTVIPDEVDGAECTITESKEIKLTLRRMSDGRWLFDSQTLKDLPRMRLALWQRALAAGQGKEIGDVPADFRSPFAFVQTFIQAFKKGDLDLAARCLDLTDIPDPARHVLGRVLAVKLKEVLDRSVFVIFQDLPDSSVGLPLEALLHKEGRIVGERQATGERKGQWLFNRATVRSIDRLYDAFEGEPILPELQAQGRSAAWPGFREAPGLWLRKRVPGWLRSQVELREDHPLALYQVLGSILLLVAVIPIYRIVIRPLTRLAAALFRWRSMAAEQSEIRSWVRPLGWLAALWVLERGVMLLDLRTETAGVILSVLIPAVVIATSFAFLRLIDPLLRLVAGPAATSQVENTLAAMGFPVISLVLKIVVVVTGLAALLKLFNFDVATVLAGLGIGGLAIALAAQDTLKNFFGSIMLIADRTFRVGDLVKIGGNEGVVESVGLRNTRLRGLDDSLLTVPNSDLTTSHVTNFGARRFRRFRTQLEVAHGTSPDVLQQFREAVLELIRNHPQIRQQKYEVAVSDLGSSGIQILIQVFFDVTDGHAELIARDSLILDILRLTEQLGISFNSPTLLLDRNGQASPALETGKGVSSPSP
jgi:MscS family membrane protein